MRIFLDANILFSAAKSAGAVREMLHQLTSAGQTCCMDEYVIEEARRNLELKSPSSMPRFQGLLSRIEVSPYQSEVQNSNALLFLPEKDRPVLNAAIRLRCDALVTGDKTHFGAFYGTTFGGVTIYSPPALAAALSL